MPYDLYGTYYANENDAINAETAQMAEIDSRNNKIKLQDILKEIEYLKLELCYLKNRVKELEEKCI